MKKKGKLQQLGIPAGYRLTNDSKRMIVRAAVEKKFYKKYDDLLTREVELMNCITEWCTPSQERIRQFQEEFNDFTGLNKGHFMNPLIDLRINIPLSVVNKHRLQSLYSSGLGGEYIELGNEYSHNCALGGWVTLVEPEAKLRELFYSQRICYLSARLNVDTLPENIYKTLIKFYKDAYKVISESRDLSTKLRQVLSQYTSAVTLCTDVEEMVGIIRLSLNLKESTNCSDVMEKDNIVELKHML